MGGEPLQCTGRSCPGQACGAGAPCFCQWPSQPRPSPSFRATAARDPPSAQGPAPPLSPGALPRQRLQGPYPAICTASPPTEQLSQLSPPPRGTAPEGRKEENPPPKKSPPPPPATLEYIKLCSLAPAPPFRSPWQPGSIPSPSLNPSPSSAKGGLRPLPTHFSQHSTGDERGGSVEGPQSSAPSSSVWGAPGGSSGSGVCPPGWR